MDHSNPTFAKILILDTGKFKQWKFRIQQYLQNEHYALWVVIEFGDSYNAPLEETSKGPASESSGRKKGRTVAITTEDIQKRRNDVKARTIVLLALLHEHHYELRAEKLARNANLLALVAPAQASQDPFYQSSRSHSDPEQAQRDKDMQKNLALIAKYFKKIYKPTNNKLRTSSNYKNKNVDTTPRKPKRVKDSAYHKEKMLLCKQAEQGVLLQAGHYDWLANMDEEVDEQELEAHYSYMAKIQEVPNANSGIDSEPVKQVQNNAEYNVFANELQHSEQSEY
nr:hypothetical protein [Tanacetum cinerariifolium]